ncbi:PTS galactitol transporter subunit IIA [Lonepinella koalarum]|uniref:PTS system galactitol-specific EIIA component (Gat family) n=1 Tax=Lonepinella koalarum TaxID=53417 RepID=A0A4R1KYL5_9PAST|nr:PTS galactitol transporter subunit IIA [Lonepinella koalarum]MDH2926735.1 PTS galactitol transporter subunit IIA [Lonepinella koalarum]TCK70605.1 PTS system galactitol-specific EIIA component (Gat family) [Lonepinella koalarum]TFJ90014.1 PTS galactitol transporter subunit IIA [Lonepinella koalarum]
MNTDVLIKTDISFHDFREALNHIADELIARHIVKASYRQSVFEREDEFPTGIELEHYAVAIPHCEAEHALKPAIYFIRPNKTVAFNRADDDGTVDVHFIIALVVTDPKEQLNVLKTLFGKLQDNQFVEQLISTPSRLLPTLIKQHLTFN